MNLNIFRVLYLYKKNLLQKMKNNCLKKKKEKEKM